MNHLTRTNIIKQAEIHMGEGSTLIYNIDITIQTEQEHSIAYRKITSLNNAVLLDPIECSLVGLLNDCPDDEDSIEIGYGGTNYDEGEDPIDSNA